MKYRLAGDTWGKEELEAIQKVIDSGRYTMGPLVEQFEKEFCLKFKTPHAVMVNSGSTANLLIWSCLVNKDNLNGDVIVPAVSWSTTYFPLLQNHFLANFVDVDKDTLNIDVKQIELAITERTVAIFAVNLLGNSCDYRRLKQLCGKYNLILIEDNCESLGAKSNITSIKERQQVDDYGNLIFPAVIDRQYCGTIGRMGSFSFFFSHHMQTMEGGMIACQNKDDADYIRSLRAHGWCRDLPDDNNIYKKTGDPFKDSFTFVTPGYSVRPLEMSGAIGSAQLKKCDKFIEQRRNNAEYFKEKFNDLSSVRIQKEIGQSSWFGFSIILEDKLEGKRDIVIKALTEIGVETRPIISGNFMKQPAMEYMNHIHRDNYDNADYLHDNGFFIGNDMTDLKENVDLVYDTIKGCI